MATKKQNEAVQAEPLPTAAEARTELGRALRIFQAFQAADRVLAVLEQHEQLTAEREQQAKGALLMKEDAQRELDKALNEVAAAKQTAADTVQRAKAEASSLLDRAKRDASAIAVEAAERVKQAEQRAADAASAEAASRAALAELAPQIDEAKQIIERAERMRAALSQ